ncbi:MAG: hypothetical protein J2P17_31225 [Mycobacterium sp.]|nr:hypothetical protein [Mycobacterium sp.]
MKMAAALETANDTATVDVAGSRFTISNRRESKHFNTIAYVDVLDSEGFRVAEAFVTYDGTAAIQRFGYAHAITEMSFWKEFRAKVGAAVVAGAGLERTPRRRQAPAQTGQEMVFRNGGHAILRCRSCKAAGRRLYAIVTVQRARLGRPAIDQSVEIDGRVTRIRDRNDVRRELYVPCPDCQCPDVDVRLVEGVYIADKTCNERCMTATGPACSCSCAGENHGGGHGIWT